MASTDRNEPAIGIELAPTLPNSASLNALKNEDPFLVAFSLTDPDYRNPLNWPKSAKWLATDILSATGFNRIMVSTIMAPALPLIAKELDMNSTEAAMALSIYLLATAFGPLIIGPLSEIYGRKSILHASNVWFLVWNFACGFASTKRLLIAARFLAGFGASAIYSLAAGVLGDVWRPEERGRSLGIYAVIPVLGGAVGPIIGGFMAARTTWRWMFWSTSIFQAVMIFVSFTSFKETYAPRILQKEAKRLRQETGDQRYQTLPERLLTNSGKSKLAMFSSQLYRALTRPLRLLFLHPIIQILAIISAFDYGVLYIALSSFSALWTDQYGQSVEISGLHYISIALGEVAGSTIGGPLMDRLFRYMKARSGSENHPPEWRLPLMFFGASFVPIGFFIYGWTAQYHVHWIVVDIGMFIAMFGGQIAGMPISAYVIEAYGEHTSSAMAAVQFARSLTAFLFPLFTPAMYKVLGYGWGNSLVAILGLFIGIPVPLVLWFWGAKLRARAISSY